MNIIATIDLWREKIIVIVAVIRDAKKFICMISMDKIDHWHEVNILIGMHK